MFQRLRLAWESWKNRRFLGRNLFAFWYEGRWRFVDPFLAYQRFREYGEDELQTARQALIDGSSADVEKFFAITKKVFDVDKFDEKTGKGATCREMAQIFDQFCVYLFDLKKSITPSPDTPLSTDTESSATTSGDTATAESFEENSTPANSPLGLNSTSSPPPLVSDSPLISDAEASSTG